MKILHFVSGELSGGAAKGSYLLHQALCKLGVDSKLLISGSSLSDDVTVIAPASLSIRKRLEIKLRSEIANLPLSLYQHRKRRIFNTGLGGIDITRLREFKSADLIHLHWVNGLVAMPTLRKIKKPIVWTMRDMWPLTGGCHYSMECERYKVGCGKCPQLGSKSDYDISRLTVYLKRKSFPENLYPVGISNWLSDIAASSPVFDRHSVRTILNNIDTDQFSPADRTYSKSVLGISQDKFVILIGAQKVTDFYKGLDLFVEACDFLNNESVHIVTFGRSARESMSSVQLPQTHLGFLADSLSLRLVYSAADVFVAPSRMDAFGKTLAESLACGTPVVCFDSTGPKDIVDHKLTGYKARPFDVKDLARGVDWVLDQSLESYLSMRDNCRKSTVERFDARVIAQQYLALYKQVLK